MKIAIVGAGWYGCHIALTLIQAGHEVEVFEKSSYAISGASEKNQNRLHLGFHYPRDFQTRLQSKEGYEWFIEHYGHLTEKVNENIYAIADHGSNIDGETFKIIMKGSGLDFEEVDTSDVAIKKYVGLNSFIKCKERVVKNNLATKYFSELLKHKINYKCFIDLKSAEVLKDLSSKYDYIVDCTWGTARKIAGLEYYFEPCIYFYYRFKGKSPSALTIMDGEFYSLYPYYDDIYTLTSVKNTPLSKEIDFNKALILLDNSKEDESLIESKRYSFEKEFKTFYPSFLEDFEFVSPEFSMKTKIKGNTDFRGCLVIKEDKLISVFSGKIDTLHIAENKIFEIIDE